MTLPRYPRYKDSGVEWLGEVPGHWEVRQVRQIASIVNGYPFDSALFDPTDGLPLVRIRDLDKSVAETFYKGDIVDKAVVTSADVLVGMDGDFNVGRWRGEGMALLNQRMCCVRGKSNVLTRLLEYALPVRLKAINDITYATTVKHLASSQVEKLFVSMPPDEKEQAQIANFLDRETAKIDELVAEQRRLMALLKEKRQAVISHAVTRGLNPDAPLKPSGIEWLGDVPAHWLVTPLGILADQIQTGPFGSQLHSCDYIDDGTPVINPSNIQGGKLIADSSCTVDLKIVERLSQHKLELGDIVFGRRGEMGRCAMVTEESIGWLCGTGSLNVRLSSKITPSFVSIYLGTNYVRELLQLESVGSTMDNLNTQILSGIPVPTPPLKEQQQISQYLAIQTDRFDTLTSEAQRAIDLLQERRTALISAAVTGQIDVRGAVAS